MKKLLFMFLLAVFTAWGGNAQRNPEEYESATKHRIIASSRSKGLYYDPLDKHKYGLIATLSPQGDTTFVLYIFFYKRDYDLCLTINKGNILLLKLGDGTNLELKSDIRATTQQEIVAVAAYEYYIAYWVDSYYSITEEQIQQIIETGVTKIRVQHRGGTFDRDIKRNKMSKHLAKAYPELKAKLSELRKPVPPPPPAPEPPKEKSVYDDF